MIRHMKINCLYDALVNITDLKAHPKNRNKHSQEQITRLAKLLAYQGLRAPVVVSKLSGYVVKGHGTIEAIKANGWPQAPCVYQSFESEEQEYAFVQSDNAIASWAELDLSGINADLPDLGPDFDIEMLGLKDFEIEPLDKFNGDSDGVPDVPKEPKTKLGDIYEIGNHRVLCGDSTSIEDVEKLMNGEKADFTITSPPYNVGLDYNSYDDKKDEKDYEVFLLKIIENCKKIASEDYWLLWNVGVYPLSLHLHLHLHLLHEHFKIKRSIAWVKKGITGPPLIYHMKKNPVVKNYKPNFGWEIIACCFLDEKKLGTKSIPSNVINESLTDVWHIDQSANSNDQSKHPGAFPVALPEKAIQLYCEKNVYEPFCGSGSTLIACEKTNRKCFGMEIDPHYVDVIVSRWCKFTGKNQIKLNWQEITWEL